MTSVATSDLVPLLDGMKSIMEDIASGDIADDELATVHRMVTDHRAISLSSARSTALYAEALVGHLESLDAVATFGKTTLAVDADRLAALASACVGHEQFVLTGPQDDIVEALSTGGIPHDVFDWEAAFLARVAEFFPKRLAKETKRLEEE